METFFFGRFFFYKSNLRIEIAEALQNKDLEIAEQACQLLKQAPHLDEKDRQLAEQAQQLEQLKRLLLLSHQSSAGQKE